MYSNNFMVINDEIKAERKRILNDAVVQDSSRLPKTNLNDKFEEYLNIVKVLDSEDEGWRGILFYYGYAGKLKKDEKAIRAAACIAILQLNFVLHTYMMYSPNLNKVDRIVQAVNKYLPRKKELINSGEDDSLLRGILTCICDYILIIVNRHLNANQEFCDIRHNILQWYMETQIGLYQNFTSFFCEAGEDTTNDIRQEIDGKSSYYLGSYCKESKSLDALNMEDKALKEIEYSYLSKASGCDVQVMDKIQGIPEKGIRDVLEMIEISIGGAGNEKRNRRGGKTS